MSTFTRSTLLMSILMLVFGNNAQASVAAAGVIWPFFFAAILLLALSQLLARTTGRYCGLVMLARAMPVIIIFLVVCGGLGTLNGITRLVFLLRHVPRPDAMSS